MVHWIAKASLQKALGLLPRRHLWNELLQEHVTQSLRMGTGAFEEHLRKDSRHFELFRKYSSQVEPDTFSVVELGTGWHPILPIAFFLCGASDVWTLDIVPLLKFHRVKETLDHFVACHQRGRLRQLLPLARAERVEEMRSIARRDWKSTQKLLERMSIHPLVGQVSCHRLPAASVDFVVSNVVLQHLGEDPLREALAEFRRILCPQGVMSHDIDLRDQYWYFDRSITPFNFLRFSDRTWRLINNPLIPLSRLRLSDYRRLIVNAGFDIREEHVVRGSADDLSRVPLATRFKNYRVEDLLAVEAWFAACTVSTAADSSSR